VNDLSPRRGLSASEIEARIDAVMTAATLAEKVGMMSGQGFFKAIREDGGVWGARPYRAGAGIDRLGVPAFFFTDGPRGVARGQSTCFPCTMARGASFDTDLERRIGEASPGLQPQRRCLHQPAAPPGLGAGAGNLWRRPRASGRNGGGAWHRNRRP
jgi:hypothetical protein